MDSSTEIEAKFDAVPKWKLPKFADLVTRKVASTELVSVYWDTKDRRLDSWGVTLRRRVVDDGAATEWTLKLPLRGSADGVQHRQEVTTDGTSETPPPELQGLLTAMARGADLKPLAELRTDRRRRRVGNDMWSDAVEITDDRVTSRVSGRKGPAFRQIEVELLDEDGHEVFDLVTDALRDAGLEFSTDASKLRRVLGTPAGHDRGKPKKKPSLELLVSGAIGSSLSEIVRDDPWIRLADDMTTVHDCRKAVRRLRLDLKTLRPVLRRRRTELLRDELKWYGTLLGQVRDLHVLRAQLLELAEAAEIPSDDRDAITDILDSQLEVERRNLLSAMDGDRYVELIERLSTFERRAPLRSSVDPGRPARGVVATAGRTSWKKLEKARRRAKDRPSPERLHNVRKKSKHAMATAQLAKDAGSKSKKFVRAAGTLKENLGDVHDADVLVQWLDRHADRLEPASAYSAGRLRERSAQRRADLEDSWPDAWKQLDRDRLRRWIK